MLQITDERDGTVAVQGNAVQWRYLAWSASQGVVCTAQEVILSSAVVLSGDPTLEPHVVLPARGDVEVSRQRVQMTTSYLRKLQFRDGEM